MEKLSIEEKAKRYDEAIERAKNFIENGDERERTIAESIFAGIMEESDDEKIRKALLRFHKSTIDVDGIKGEDVIAWLEKQGEQSKWKPSKDEMDALYGLAYITNKMDDKKDEAVTKLYQDLKREFFNGASYENMFPSSPVNSDINIKKQGEQKPAEKVEEIWIPQSGDIIRKKGTTEPTYTLCRKEGIYFSYVQNMDNGIAGGYLSVYSLSDYELVERPKTIEEAINELFKPLMEATNKQKQEWSEEDEDIMNEISAIVSDFRNVYKDSKEALKDADKIDDWLKSLRPQNRWKPVDKNVYVVNGIVLAQKKDKSDPFKGYVLCKDHTLTPDEYERYINISDINSQSHWKPSDEHYELEEFAKIVRGNLTGISKAVQKLFEAKYLQLTGNKMYGGFKD